MVDLHNTNIREAWLEQLQESGCWITSPRRAKFSILANSDQALEAVEISDQSRTDHPQPYLVSVKPRVSRSTQSSGISELTSTWCISPFISKVVMGIRISFQ